LPSGGPASTPPLAPGSKWGVTATQSPPQRPGSPVPAPAPAPPGRPSWRPVPGLWGRTLVAALALLAGYLVLRGPVADLFSGLLERMAVTEKAEEVDVDVLVLELTPDDAPLEFGSRDGTEDGPVRALQVMLTELGFDPGTPDGVFGAGTEEAVRTFQQSQIGLEATGRADEVTINVIRRVFSGRDLETGTGEITEEVENFDPGGDIDDPLNPENSGTDPLDPDGLDGVEGFDGTDPLGATDPDPAAVPDGEDGLDFTGVDGDVGDVELPGGLEGAPD